MSTVKRVLKVVLAIVVLLAVLAALETLSERDTQSTETAAGSDCFLRTYLVLQAQSVPTAQLIPCVANDLEGWDLPTESYSNNGSRVVLTSSDTGTVTWTLALEDTCSPSGDARTVPHDARMSGGATVPYEKLESSSTADGIVTRTNWFTFPGGCLTSSVAVPERYDEARIFGEIDATLQLIDRSAINASIEKKSDGAFGLDP